MKLTAASVTTLLLVAYPPRATDAATEWTYMSVPDPEALNLDGSRYGIAVCMSSNKSSTAWSIWAEGGGWCYDEKDCLARSKSSFGSNKTWAHFTKKTLPDLGPTDYDYGPTYLDCSEDSQVNKGFFFYGDGAARTGDRKEPWPVPGTDEVLYFRGARSLYAGIDLMLSLGMSEATDVVFAGCSAGGHTVWMHLDAVTEYLATRAAGALVVGYPVSGFFADLYSVYPKKMEYVFHMQNSIEHVPKSCLDVHTGNESWKCIMAPHVAPLIETPWFAAQSRFDFWQVLYLLEYPANSGRTICADHTGLPCPGWHNRTAGEIEAIEAYGPAFMSQFGPLMSQPGKLNGGFLDQCVGHCLFSSRIDGLTRAEAFVSWYGNIKKVKRPGDAQPHTLGFQRWWKFDCDGSDEKGPCGSHGGANNGTLASHCVDIYSKTNYM